MGDLDRQSAIKRAVAGCFAAALLLIAIVVSLALWSGPTPVSGGILIAVGLGLRLLGWVVE